MALLLLVDFLVCFVKLGCKKSCDLMIVELVSELELYLLLRVAN